MFVVRDKSIQETSACTIACTIGVTLGLTSRNSICHTLIRDREGRVNTRVTRVQLLRTIDWLMALSSA